jgi:hypothetical protein
MLKKMSEGRPQDALKKLIQVVEGLSSEKRIAATKWLEGVIVGQVLDDEERASIVEAVNEYLRSADEKEYAGAVNVLVEYLKEVQANDENQVHKNTLIRTT